MQVGHDGSTISNLQIQAVFRQDKHLSAFTFYLQQSIFGHQRLSADGMLISNLHKALVR
jgi:hypothetical protein